MIVMIILLYLHIPGTAHNELNSDIRIKKLRRIINVRESAAHWDNGSTGCLFRDSLIVT